MHSLILNSAENLNNYIAKEEKELEKLAESLQSYKNFMVVKTDILNDKLPEIEKILNKSGFELVEIYSMIKTGIHGSYKDMKPDDKLRVSCELKMIGRRMPIDLSTYKHEGRKNRSKVLKIAKDIQNTLKEKLNVLSDLNYYFLDKSEGILFDMWI